MARFPFIPAGESTDLGDDIRELFDEISTLPHAQRAYSGECHPSVDVLETDSELEVAVDVAGVPAEAIRVLFRRDTLIVVGEKAPAPVTDQQTFHLVEREFGRFARVVRLNGAFDIAASRATLRAGELRIVLPKLEDRRGMPRRIPISVIDPKA